MIYIKTKKEIDYIRESCRLVAETLQLLKKNVRPGVTTAELDKIADDYILSNSAKSAFKGYSQGGSVRFPGSICVSVDEEVVHGIPSGRILKEGEIVSLDCGVVKNGYFGDAALTVAVGQISDAKSYLMRITEESLYKGIEQAVENNRISDISYAVQNYVESNGLSVVRDLTGHGVGRYLHEDPAIPNFGRKGTGPKLKSGMTLAIEPMVNAGTFEVCVAEDEWTIFTEDNYPSAHYEHTVLVEKGKAEILTVC